MARFASEIQVELTTVYDKLKDLETKISIASAQDIQHQSQFRELEIAIARYKNNFAIFRATPIVSLKVFADARDKIEKFDEEANKMKQEIKLRASALNKLYAARDAVSKEYNDLKAELDVCGAIVLKFQ